MWKKSEVDVSEPVEPKRTAPARVEHPTPKKARIGSGIVLKGELRGNEDVVIEGRVEGSITLEQHGVLVEESGKVDADITASSICVAGEVNGNLHGSEQVVLLKTGRVEGNIYAKSVTLETGAQFKGSIDMETVSPVRTSNLETSSKTKANGAPHGIAAS